MHTTTGFGGCKYYIKTREDANYFSVIIDLYAKNNNSNSKDEALKSILEFEKYILEHGTLERLQVLRAYRMGLTIVDAIENTRYTTIDNFIKELYENKIIPLIETIKAKKYRTALEYYKDIFGLLITNFSLGEECAIVTTQIKKPVSRGKAKFYKRSSCV